MSIPKQPREVPKPDEDDAEERAEEPYEEYDDSELGGEG
jgi:hypothetical protein